MNIYLAIVPKGPVPNFGRHLARIIEDYRPHLAPGFSRNPQKIDGPGGTVVLRFKRKNLTSPVGRCIDGRYEVIAGGNIHSQQVADRIERHGPSFSLFASPGGIYSAIALDRRDGTLRAWSSQPTQDCIFHAETKRFFLVSNRPLLCALGVQPKGQVELDGEYLRQYLAAGYSPAEVSPFRHVRCNLPEEQLVIRNGSLSFIGLPQPPVPSSAGCSRQQQIDLLSERLLTSIGVLDNFDQRAAFHLSGGKDSRLLAAGFGAAGRDVSALTYGYAHGSEARVSEAVARAAGLDHQIAKRRLAAYEPREAARLNLADSEGMLPSAAPQIMYSKNDAAHPGLNSPMVLGHIHLQRGGWGRRTAMSERSVLQYLRSQVTKYVRSETGDFFHDRVAQLRERRGLKLDIHALYWLNHDLRAGRYLAASWIDTNRLFVPVHPMIDERFAAACSGFDAVGRVNESLAFGAMVQLAPQLAKIPLHDDHWRFEACKRHPSYSGEHFEMRRIGIDEHPLIAPGEQEKMVGFNAFSPRSIAKIGAIVAQGFDDYPLIAKTVRPRIVAAVHAIENGNPREYAPHLSAQSFVETMTFRKYLWRLFAATQWLEGDWLKTAEVAEDREADEREVLAAVG